MRNDGQGWPRIHLVNEVSVPTGYRYFGPPRYIVKVTIACQTARSRYGPKQYEARSVTLDHSLVTCEQCLKAIVADAEQRLSGPEVRIDWVAGEPGRSFIAKSRWA